MRFLLAFTLTAAFAASASAESVTFNLATPQTVTFVGGANNVATLNLNLSVVSGPGGVTSSFPTSSQSCTLCKFTLAATLANQSHIGVNGNALGSNDSWTFGPGTWGLTGNLKVGGITKPLAPSGGSTGTTGALVVRNTGLGHPGSGSAELTGTLSNLTMTLLNVVGPSWVGNMTLNFSGMTVSGPQATRGFTGTLSSGSIELTAVPEPSTWAMMFTGVGLIAISRHRRKSSI
jgi:PEP-CTERM motif